MKFLLRTSLLLLVCTGIASAATLTYSQNGTVGSAGSTFTFTQFNTSLGTLSAIDLIINSGVPGGNFTLTRANSGGNTLGYLTAFTETLSFSDDIDTIFTGQTTNVAFTGNSTIPKNMGTRVFDINAGQSLLSTYPTLASIASGSWSVYTGNSTVDISAAITPEATFTSGLGITASYVNLSTPTSLTLRYTYSTSAVPEPGQVAASLLLLGGIGGYIFVKRRCKTSQVVL
jgi:hypothetical protein